jgi:hypothetical protein
MQHGSITLNCRQKDSQRNSIIQLLLWRSLRLPLQQRKLWPLFFLDTEACFGRHTTWSKHELRSNLCRNILGEFNLTEMLLKSSCNVIVHDPIQARKHNKQSQNSDGLVFTTHLTFQILFAQISVSLEPCKRLSMGRGLRVMMRSLKKWRSGCGQP